MSTAPSLEIPVTQEFIDEMEAFRQVPKGKAFIESCSDNVVVFSERMLGIRPYAWQVYLLKHLQESVANPELQKEFVALTSRQIGKSTLVAIFSLWVTIFNKYPSGTGNNTSVLVTSASDVQAKKLLNEMRKLLRIGDRFMSDKYQKDSVPIFGKTFFTGLLSEQDPNNTTTISFKEYNKDIHGLLLKDSKSGSVIKSYPPTSSVLGETAGIVVIDEAGKTDKISDEFFYDYVYPVGNTTNAIRLYTSTPWVSAGFFFNMVDPENKKNADIKPLTAVFTVDAIKIENPKMHRTILTKSIAQLESDGKLDEIQRAYYCRFVKGDTSYFNPEKVMGVFDEGYEMVDEFSTQCDMGVDFGGQTTSKSVITISYLTEDGVIKRIYKKVYPVGKDLNMLEDIEHLLTKFNVQRIIPDSCPQGDYFIREMQEKGWNVFPMNFKADKVKKYGSFRSMLNKGKIKSFIDPALRNEMLALEMTQGERTIKIKHAPGYTDDEVDSFLMSTYFMLHEDGGVKTFDYY
jgi:hypothetical protein